MLRPDINLKKNLQNSFKQIPIDTPGAEKRGKVPLGNSGVSIWILNGMSYDFSGLGEARAISDII